MDLKVSPTVHSILITHVMTVQQNVKYRNTIEQNVPTLITESQFKLELKLWTNMTDRIQHTSNWGIKLRSALGYQHELVERKYGRYHRKRYNTNEKTNITGKSALQLNFFKR